MRKIFSLMMVALFSVAMWASDPYYTFSITKPSSGAVSDYTKTGKQTIDGIEWEIPGNWYATGALRLGGKSIENVDRTITAQAPMTSAISKIRIAHAGKTADAIVLNYVKVTTATDAAFTENVSSVSVTPTIAKNKKDTIDLVPASGSWAKDLYYKFDFNFTNSNGSNYSFVVEKILFYNDVKTTRTIYCKMVYDWWTKDDAAIAVHTEISGVIGSENAPYPGVRMEKVEGEKGVWKAEIDPATSIMYFARVNPTGDVEFWGAKTSQLYDIPADKDLFTITNETARWESEGNACGGEWSVYVPSVPADPTAAAKGDWDTWTDDLAFTLAADKASASASVNLKEGNCNFKMIINGEWRSNEYWFKRGEVEGVAGISSNKEKNMAIVADAEGEYILTWYFANDSLAITFPKKPIEPGEGYYLKNNWDGGSDWYWKTMEETGVTDVYQLDHVVYGGTGINYNTKAEEAGKGWIAEADILVNYGKTIGALDTVTFYLNAGVDPVQITVDINGKYVAPPAADPVLKIGGTWGAEDAWLESDMDLAADKATASYKVKLEAQNYEFKIISDGTYLTQLGSDGMYRVKRDWPKATKVNVSEGGSPNLLLEADQAGEYEFIWTLADSSLAVIFPKPQPLENYVVLWDADEAKQVGQVIMHTGAAVAKSKLYKNTVDVTAINLSNTYAYAGDKYAVLKPAVGKFLAGDKVIFSTFINNKATDGSKYGRVQFYASDGATMLFEGQDGINGQHSDEDPLVETFTLNTDQDSLLFGRYGNTATYVYEVNVSRNGVVPTDPTAAAKGNWDGFAEELAFTMAADKASASATVTLKDAGYCDFKMIINGEWRSNEYWFKRGEVEGVAGISSNMTQNMSIVADVAGDYILTWYFANDSLHITFPEKTEPATVLYMKNNWDGGSDWYWKTMEETETKDLYMLNNVVFGGTGVNFDVTTESPDPNFVALEDIVVMDDKELGALDTVNFYLERTSSAIIIKAEILGKYVAPDPVIRIGGTWGAESAWVESDMDLAADKATASITITIPTMGEYEFKIISDGVYLTQLGADGLYRVHRDWPKATKVNVSTDGAANLLLAADVSGDYVFTWNLADSSLAVTFPEGMIPMKTVYAVNRLAWTTVYAYVWRSADSQSYHGWPGEPMEVSAAAPAHYQAKAGETIYSYSFVDEGYDMIIFHNNDGEQTVDVALESDKPYYLLAGDKNGEGKYDGGSWSKEVPTALDEINVDGSAVKVLQKGQIFILKGDKVYNVTGQVVK